MIVYSRIEKAKANGISPEAYLNLLLGRRPNSEMTAEELDQLMSWSDVAKTNCSDME